MRWELTERDLKFSYREKVRDLLLKAKKIKSRIENDVHPLSDSEIERVSQIARNMLDTCLIKLGKATQRNETIYEGERVETLKLKTWMLIEYQFKTTKHHFYNGTEQDFYATMEEE